MQSIAPPTHFQLTNQHGENAHHFLWPQRSRAQLAKAGQGLAQLAQLARRPLSFFLSLSCLATANHKVNVRLCNPPGDRPAGRFTLPTIKGRRAHVLLMSGVGVDAHQQFKLSAMRLGAKRPRWEPPAQRGPTAGPGTRRRPRRQGVAELVPTWVTSSGEAPPTRWLTV